MKQGARTPGSALGLCSPVAMGGAYHCLHHPRSSTKAAREVVRGRGQEVVIQSGLGLLDSRIWKQLRIDFLGAA